MGSQMNNIVLTKPVKAQWNRLKSILTLPLLVRSKMIIWKQRIIRIEMNMWRSVRMWLIVNRSVRSDSRYLKTFSLDLVFLLQRQNKLININLKFLLFFVNITCQASRLISFSWLKADSRYSPGSRCSVFLSPVWARIWMSLSCRLSRPGHSRSLHRHPRWQSSHRRSAIPGTCSTTVFFVPSKFI